MKKCVLLYFVLALMSTDMFAQDTNKLHFLSIEDLEGIKIRTASKVKENIQTAPATIYVITERDIIQNGCQDLQEALKSVPSVYLSNPHSWIWGGQRGFLSNFSQTLLMINGREVNNLIAFEGFISRQFATTNIKQIEVLAGPGSSIYGANALAGVINIITKDGSIDYEGIEVHMDQGSFGTVGGGLLFAKSFTEDFSDWISKKDEFLPGWFDKEIVENYDGFNNYKNPSMSTPIDFRIDYKGFYGGMNYYYNKQSHGQEKATWTYENQEDIRKFGLWYAGYEDKISEKLKLKVEHQYINSKFWGKYYSGFWPVSRLQSPDEAQVYQFGTWTVNSGDRSGHIFNMVNYDRSNAIIFDETANDTIVLQDYYSSFAGYLMDQGLIDSNNVTKEDLEDYFVHIYGNKESRGSQRNKSELQLKYEIHDKHSIVLGFVYDRIDYVGLAVTDAGVGIYSTYDFPIDENKRENVYTSIKEGVFIQYQGKLIDNKLWLTIGARSDHQNHYGPSINQRSGIIYKPHKSNTIKLLYGEAFREGNVFELTGNPTLSPAKMRSFELNFDQKVGKSFKLSLAYYNSQVSNFIGSVGSLIGENVESVESQNVSGIEHQFRFERKGVSAFVSGSYLMVAKQKAKAEGTSELIEAGLLGVPKFKTSGGISCWFNSYIGAGITNHYIGAMDAMGGSSGEKIHIDAYNDLSATLFTNKLKLFKQVKSEVFVSVKNVLGQEYYHPNIRKSGTEKFLQNGRYIIGRLIIHM